MIKLLATPLAYILVKLFKCEVYYPTGGYTKCGNKQYKEFKF